MGFTKLMLCAPLAFQFLHDFNEPFAALGFADPAVADFLILTKTQRSEQPEKKIAPEPFYRYGRFLPLVGVLRARAPRYRAFCKIRKKAWFSVRNAPQCRGHPKHIIPSASQKLKLSVFEIQRQSASNSSKQKPTSCGVCASDACNKGNAFAFERVQKRFFGA